ncbi:MAG: hypothetical protein IMF07_05355 [Proteobacteria bacterium]|nr:hypothetical protein [Pseudomonadota bacterium]
MKKLGRSVWVLLVISVLFLGGCAGVCGVPKVNGFLWTDIEAPLNVTSNKTSRKVGTAKCESILGLFATGDCSIKAAVKDGKIKTIHHIDHKIKNILGVYAEFTVIVYGN